MAAKTSIAVRKEIRDQLASLGNKDDSFDDIVLKLIEFWRDRN